MGTVEKLIDKLVEGAGAERNAALNALTQKPLQEVLTAICQTLLRDLASEAQAACMDLAERLGGSVSLEEIRTDGWLSRLGRQIGSFEAVTAIIGQRYLAYAIILGVQIRTLTRDPTTPANTMVEFSTGDNLQQVLPLGEFRAQLVRAMLQIPEEFDLPLSLPLTSQAAESLIGQVTLLLSPLFDYSIRFIAVHPAGESLDGVVGVLSPSGFGFFPIRAFRETIRLKLSRDEAGTREEPFRIDLTAIEEARNAHDEGDHEKVIAQLETWPGLLATLLKTPIARSLNDNQLSIIAEGLLMLGDSFHTLERDTWAEELYRLGLQYTRGVPASAPLFLRLGMLLAKQERFGEAIAFFRRADVMGEQPLVARSWLARCLLRRDRIVGAALLLQSLIAQGHTPAEVLEDARKAQALLTEAGLSWPVIL